MEGQSMNQDNIVFSDGSYSVTDNDVPLISVT
jgi:hypothetical protein